MKFNFFTGKKKRSGKKHKKHVRKVAVKKDETESRSGTGKIKPTKVPKSKEMILSPSKEDASLFIANKGEVTDGELLDADGQYVLNKLGKETSITSYVYVIPPGKGRPAIVDLTVDGVWAFVREAAKRKIALLKITEAKVEDIVVKTKQGETTVVRAMTKCEDENGFAHYGVKDEERYKERTQYDKKGNYIGKVAKFDIHASTIALEKAQKKAIISHPSFPRIEARAFVERQLLSNKEALHKLGLDPATLLPSGGIKSGRGKYSDVFAKGKSLGFTSDKTREVIASTGKRLSERKTAEEVGDALRKLDEAGIGGEIVNPKTGEIKQPAGTTLPPARPTVPTERPEAEKKPAKRFLANIKFPDNIPPELSEHLDYVLTFGKFNGQPIKQILETNADYLRWFADDCDGKIKKGEKLSGTGNAVITHLSPVFTFLKENGLVKTEKPEGTK